MFAAAEGRSTLGIPESIGKEFVGKDETPKGAGIIVLDPESNALFLKRGQSGDHPGTWAFPGGTAEEGESPEQTATREFNEELGSPDFTTPIEPLAVHQATEPVNFVTFLAKDVPQFLPKLNDEHTAYAWAPLDDPPQPLHPGVAKMLEERRAQDETFTAAYDARLATGADAAMAMDYADRVVSLLSGSSTYRVGIAFDRESVRSTDADGRLHVLKANISKAVVNPYLGREIPDYETLGLEPDKVYKLLRHPDELKKAVKTFNNLPLLSEHVPVSAEDHQPDIVVGSLGTDANYEHPFLTNSLVVWAKHGIDGIESDEQKELSSAYRYKADMTPGEYEGEPYDGVMRDIVGNHVALVKKGRAGSDVVVGDSNPQEIEIMAKSKLTRTGVLLHGALAAALLPKLAKDAAIDISPVLANIDAKNFASKKAGIVPALKKITAGKLAKDASLDDVTGLLDKLEKAGVDELDPNSAAPMAGGEEDDGYDAMDAGGLNEQAKAFLAGKLSPEDMAQFEQLCGAGASDEDDDEAKKKADEEAAAKKKAEDEAAATKEKENMVDKKAMDAALAKTRKDVEQNTMARVQAITEAKEAVEPYVGKIKVNMATDSAEKIYVDALKALGMDGVDDLPVKALQKLLATQKLPGQGSRETTVAQDAAMASPTNFVERFPGASRLVG